LSEFSGCNRALGGVLKINPYNVDEITKTIDLAINMPPEEKEQRMKIASNYIGKHSTYKWAESFLKDLKRSHQPCESEGSGGAVLTGGANLGVGAGSMGGGASTAELGMPYKYMILGLGLNQTLIKTRQAFQELRLNYVE
jgi:Glycosyltransferase family 20